MYMLFQDGRLPIHFASIHGHTDMVRTLVKLGSDPKSPSHDKVHIKIVYI